MNSSVIKEVDLMQEDQTRFSKQLADVIILTKDNILYLQKRPTDRICLFGGHVEENETPMIAAMREIKEETGGEIQKKDLVFVGAITEEWTQHAEIVHVYFWHDKQGTITGCYEHAPVKFKDRAEALCEQGLMDYTKWALNKAYIMNLMK